MAKDITLTVNLNQETADALKRITAQRETNYVETIRRAISILDWFESQSAKGGSVLVTDAEGETRQVQWP